jgi:hypothetical protein
VACADFKRIVHRNVLGRWVWIGWGALKRWQPGGNSWQLSAHLKIWLLS